MATSPLNQPGMRLEPMLLMWFGVMLLGVMVSYRNIALLHGGFCVINYPRNHYYVVMVSCKHLIIAFVGVTMSPWSIFSSCVHSLQEYGFTW